MTKLREYWQRALGPEVRMSRTAYWLVLLGLMAVRASLLIPDWGLPPLAGLAIEVAVALVLAYTYALRSRDTDSGVPYLLASLGVMMVLVLALLGVASSLQAPAPWLIYSFSAAWFISTVVIGVWPPGQGQPK